MPILHINFRAVDVTYELKAIEEYLNNLEKNLPIMQQQTKERIYNQLIENMSEEDEMMGMEDLYQEDAETVSYAFEQLFRAPFVLTLWSLYESTVTDIANDLKERFHHKVRMNELRGDFWQRAEKYYTNVLGFDIAGNKPDLKYLKSIYLLRNAIAHGNSRKDIVNPEDWKKLQRWEKEGAAISLNGGRIVLSEKALRDMLKVIRESLMYLVNQVPNTDVNNAT